MLASCKDTSSQGSHRERALRTRTAALRSNFSSFASRGPSTTRRSAMVRRRKPRGIHSAADDLDLDRLKRILAADTDPNRVVSQGQYRGTTPLLVLCGELRRSGRIEEDVVACATALIDAGADVNFSRRSWRVTPLMLAAGWPDHDDCGNYPMPRLVSMLIAAGADVTSTGQAALKAALASCYSESWYSNEASTRNAVRVVSMLIDAGVSVRGKRLDKLVPSRISYEPALRRISYEPALPNDRVLAILLRAGARIPKRLEYAVYRYSLRRPYLWNMSFAGSVSECFQSYERRCLESLTAIFAPKLTQLPEEIIPTIVRYAFHPGMYASTGAPAALTPFMLEYIRISLAIPAGSNLHGTLDAMFRAGVNWKSLTKLGSRLKPEWVPPLPEGYLRPECGFAKDLDRHLAAFECYGDAAAFRLLHMLPEGGESTCPGLRLPR